MYHYLLLIIIVMVVAVSYIGSGILASYYLRFIFGRKVSHSQTIFLTFDDGPDANVTPKILELLKSYGVRATFFPSGVNMVEYPELVRKIIESGHDIGDHGYYHIHPWMSGPVKTIQDINKTREVFRSLGEKGMTKLCRPPYGKINLVQLIYWLWERKRFVFWTLDPKDYQGSSGEKLGREVVERLAPGSVVLLHDSRRNPDSDAGVTLEVVKMILQEAQESQITFSTISEMLGETENKHTFSVEKNV
ncbi:MAG: polysaccharide deacetylase family protein [Planctomycetes bacterium]|nr:polysaccharide deacetylase family protein [Planctomycetota bacterium]